MDEELLNEEIEEETSEEASSEEASSEEETSEEAASSEESESGFSREEVVDALREIINENNENDLEGDNLLTDNDVTPDPVPTSVVVDYTEQLDAILTQLENDALARQEYEEYESQTIFDKPLNEFTVSESIGALAVCFGLCLVVVVFIRHFTPQLWK